MSADHRWFKFWPQDWQRDPALRSCGIAARGLWMDLLCIMHEGEPYGHLTIGGKNPTARQIGIITGVSEKEAVRLLEELESVGVFSRNSDGVIYSRRMVRDKAASDAGRESGKRGGNPALKGDNKGSVNGTGGVGGLTPSDNVHPYRPPQSLETEFKRQSSRSRKEESFPSERCPTNPAYTSDFEEWWAAYPERFPSDSKARAAKAYAKALKSVSAGFLLEQLRSYRFPDKPQFRKMAATWLNECSWEDRKPDAKPTLKSRMAWMFNEDGSLRPPEEFVN